MSKDISEIFLSSLKELKDDIRQLDGKFDEMRDVLAKNTVVLVEHEKRSTTSEQRLNIIEKKVAGVHGFFFYSGILLSTLATLIGIVLAVSKLTGK